MRDSQYKILDLLEKALLEAEDDETARTLNQTTTRLKTYWRMLAERELHQTFAGASVTVDLSAVAHLVTEGFSSKWTALTAFQAVADIWKAFDQDIVRNCDALAFDFGSGMLVVKDRYRSTPRWVS